MGRNIFSIMTDPRGFMKALPIKRIGKMPIYLAWVIGMVYLMRQATGFQLSFYYSYGLILLGAAILAIPFGYIVIYLFTFFLFWAGKLFKGKASFNELFSASAYARVPEIFVLISWLLLTLFLGQATFTQVYVLTGLPQLVNILLFVQIFFYVWEFVISLHTIGEVQGFSAWMSLWNYILAGVIVVVIALIVEFFIAAIFSLDIHGTSSVSKLIGLIT